MKQVKFRSVLLLLLIVLLGLGLALFCLRYTFRGEAWASFSANGHAYTDGVVRTGQVLDRKATKEQGAPVYKTCERCSGNGFTSVKSANAHRAIQMYIPDLHQSSWSRNWKPFYEGLVDTLHKGERQAAAEFEKATYY